jgi:hypothetical protein
MNQVFHDVHDVNVAISNNLVHSFVEIPKHLQSAEVAQEWCISMHSVKKKPLETCMAEVPADLWSPKFLLTLTNLGCNILKFIDPEDKFCQELGFTSVRINYKHLASLDEKYRSQFAEHLAWNNCREMHFIAKAFPWIRGHLTEDAVIHCCANIDFVMGYEVIPEGIARRLLINGDGFEAIRAHGRLDILAEQIAAGEWPQRLSAFGYPGECPKSLDDGIYCASETLANKDRQALYMAYVMTHPMDQVVPLMCERWLYRLVLEMYSKEALTPYMKKYRDLRGALLEDSLGL